ncbi:MAG TPA: MmgE/PrpD family protein [Acetobacteraceae bacterium]|jgi:2-methylcitrate dehydratase PrpD|nr:MmgE/PrpD family protein [Acetobacteraceae bacterium]
MSAEPALGLAAFVSGLRLGDIPAVVQERAVHHVLDSVGIAHASTRYDFAHRTLTALQGLGGAGSVPVFGLPARLPPRDAAIMNGLLCHGLDFDDTHLGGVIHPTAAVFPAAFAAALHVGATGEELLIAYIAGVEAATRIASVAGGLFHAAGFHPTGVVNAFASALAAGRLFGLTERELVHAQGIALATASGSLEFLEDGAWNKRLHPGWAAQAGITAASLARQGFIGATRPYSGRFGFYNAYLGARAEGLDLGRATAGLGTVWELAATSIKPFPACHFTHAAIDAALVLRDGVAAGDIESITALVPEQVIPVVCEPEANKQRPANAYDAQFSVPFLVAAAWVRGQLTLAELEPETLADPDILALAGRVGYAVDPDSPFPRTYSGELVVRLRDGRTLRHREEINRGAPDRPLSNADITAKYRGNAAMALTAGAADRIEQAVLSLAQYPVAALAESIAPRTVI